MNKDTVDPVISIIKDHLKTYKVIKISYVVEDNRLTINLFPEFCYLKFDSEIKNIVENIEELIQEKKGNLEVKINVYNKLYKYLDKNNKHK